jgi:protein-L-isoaspartate(D-aspartate) O-methyltransferase
MTIPQATDYTIYADARASMLNGQLRPNRVTDSRLLDAMGAIPRENFVPQPLAGIAYSDEDISIARNRYLMQPMILARLIQEAGICATDKVLDVGVGTGYAMAVMSSLAQHVVGLESDPALVPMAVRNLASLGIGNTDIQLGVLREGWAPAAPYDVIVINGCVDYVPDALLDQLAPRGRLVAVVRQHDKAHAAHFGEARLYLKIGSTVSHRALFDANIKPLPGFAKAEVFTF